MGWIGVPGPFLAIALEMCRNLPRRPRVRYAVRMFSPSRRWLLTAVSGASLLACDGAAPEREASRTVVAPEAPRPGKLPEPQPDPEVGGEAGDEGSGDPGGGDVGATLDLPSVVDPEAGPPEDYGQIKPPVPPPSPDALTVHAMAGYEVVTVYSQPDLTSPKLGYMRIGTKMMVGERIDNETCKNGFYALPAEIGRAHV